MIVSKPCKINKFTTNVYEDVEGYLDTRTYTDGYEVRVSDDSPQYIKDKYAKGIYEVYNVVDEKGSTKFDKMKSYNIGDKTYDESYVNATDVIYKAIEYVPIDPDDTYNCIEYIRMNNSFIKSEYTYQIFGQFVLKSTNTFTGQIDVSVWKKVIFSYNSNNDVTYNYTRTEEIYSDDQYTNLISSSSENIDISIVFDVNYGQGIYFIYKDILYITMDIGVLFPSINNKFESTGYTVERSHKLLRIRDLERDMPFDTKQYTSIKKMYDINYKIYSDEKFDSVALGNIKGSTVDIKFYDRYGTLVNDILGRSIDGRVDIHEKLDDSKTTVVFYANSIIDKLGYVDITIHTKDIYGIQECDLGMILIGISVDIGNTNLEFQNNGKDYSPKKQSEISGYIDYIEGLKVMIHKGSIDMNIERYDVTSRFIRDFLGSLVIIDGSDSKNIESDSINVFDATKMIARFSSISQKTKVKNNKLDNIVTIDFTAEEIV